MREFEQALRLAPDDAVADYSGYGWRRLDFKSITRAVDSVQARAALGKAAQSEDSRIKKMAEEALKKANGG